MYDEGFGNLFHSQAAVVSCRDLIRYYPYVTEKNWSHGRQGKWMDRKGNVLAIKKCDGVLGKTFRQRQRIQSPDTERKLRLFAQTESEDGQKELAIAVESLPKYPSWISQNYNILSRVDCPRSSEVIFQEEIRAQWEEWSLTAARDYFQGKQDPCPQFNATPPWKGILEKNTSIISQRMRISSRIAQDFHQNHRSFAVFDCHTFFEKEQMAEDFRKELNEFIKHAKQRICVKWPLSVGRIMLEEGDSWIPRLVDGSCREDFKSVAATMSRLLYDVLTENFEGFRQLFTTDDRCLLNIEAQDEEHFFDLWKALGSIKEMAVVPRVEHLLYPRHFPAMNIDIRGWFEKVEKFSLPAIPSDCRMLNERLSLLITNIGSLDLSMETLSQWDRMYKELEDISKRVAELQGLLRLPPVVFDRAKRKADLVKRVGKTKEDMGKILLSWQAGRNRVSHSLFASWCRRLCDADVLEQLRSIGELYAEMPEMEERVSEAHMVYSTAWEHFDLPDVDIRDYWEISRLPRRLSALAGCVWQRIEQDREFITRKVVDRTSNNYFEAETTEREVDQMLKKYKNQTKIAELQRTAVRLSQAAVRCKDLVESEKELEGERVLLGLPGFGMNILEMLKVTQYFADLAELQYKTMSHEQTLLQSRVMDLEHEETLKTTQNLQELHRRLEERSCEIGEKYSPMPESVLKRTKEILDKVTKLLPVINAVHNQGMKERHWEEVLKEVEMGAELRGNPIVGDLLQMKITEKAEKLEEISAMAEREMRLEESVRGMKAQWDRATFDMRGMGLLISAELSSQMAAHIAKSQQILTSPYAFTILEQLRTWLDTLLQLHTFVELHNQCERLWHRVEGVFSTEDVAYQMPTEFRIFKKISLLWQQINSKITDEKPILEQLKAIIELNTLLTELTADFEVLEKGFHSYLRKKRLVFPRLHLLDDGKLLQLLSIAREPQAVNQVVRSLFPNVKLMIFNKRGEVEQVELLDGKKLKLSKAINVPVAKRHVEKWLAELDREVKTTVRLLIKKLLEKYSFTIPPVEEMVEEETHVAVVFYRIVLTHKVEEALRHSQMTELEDELKVKLKEAKYLLEQSGKQKAEPLLVLLHQHIEAVNDLLTNQVIFADDVVWRRRFRLYWNLDQVFVRVFDIATRFDYDVATPLSSLFFDKLLGIALTWNRFGVALSLPDIVPSSNVISSALGRPLLDVSGEGQPAEGGLWLGPVAVCRGQFSPTWKSAVNDVMNNMAAGTNKVLVSKGEIPVNPSLLPLSSLCGKHVESVDTTTARLASVLSIYDFNDPQRWAAHISYFIRILPILFNLPPVPTCIVDLIWKDAISTKNKESKLEKEAVALALLYGIGSQITDEYWSEFAALLPEAKVHNSVGRKCEELLGILKTQQAVIVCGGSLSGKTKLIEKAAEEENMQLHTDKSELEHGPGWFLIDGDREKVSWVLNTIQPTALSCNSFLPKGTSLIFECDALPEELCGHVPVVFVDYSSQDPWSAAFSLSETVSLSAVCKELPEFSSRLFRDRVSRLSILTDEGCASFLQVVLFVLESLDLEEEIQRNCAKTLQLSYPGYFFPPRLTWEECVETLFSLGYIVLLPSSHGQSSVLEKVIGYLESKELVVVEVNLNVIEGTSDIEEFLKRCELLFGGERNVVICLKDFHRSPSKLQEFVRSSRRNNIHRFLATSSLPFDSFPERISRYLFFVMEQLKDKRDLYPQMAYEKVIEAASRNVKVRDVRDAIRQEIGRSVSQLIDVDGKYAELRREFDDEGNPAHKLARGKELVDVEELVNVYRQYQLEQRKGRTLEDEPVVTNYAARRLSFLEKCLSTPGCSLIVCMDVERDDSFYWVDLAVSLLGLEKVQSIPGVLEDEDIRKALRRCLLENQPVLLVVEISESRHLQLLHSLVVSRCVPPAFLSQQLTTEFCEKHTVEGRGMWKRMSAALGQSLRVCLLVRKDNFREFFTENRELCEVSLVEWSPPPSRESISSAVLAIVKQGNVLDEKQLLEFERKMDKLVLPEEEDKLELARVFVRIARTRKDSVKKVMSRYERGMETLRLAEEQTGSLQVELSRLRPELVRTSYETSMLMSSIERETIEVENAREVVAANEHKSNQAAIAAQALRAESEADLAAAIPALEASIEALETLSQNDVSTLKTMRFPPYGVRLCMEAVCILLGEAAARVPNPDGGFVNDYWPTGLKMLSDIHFLSRVRNFPRDSVSRTTMKIIKDRYLSKPEFDPEHIKQVSVVNGKLKARIKCSLAAEGLCLWVKAIEFYHRISRIVEPKKAKLKQAELLVKTHLKQLEVKRKALQKVTEKLQQLSDQFGQMSQRKQDLQTQISTCEARIDRAERLVAALEGEKEKWLLKMEFIREDLRNLPCYCLVIALALQGHSHETQTQRKESMGQVEEQLADGTAMEVTNEHLLNLCNYPFLFYNDYGRGWKVVSSLFPETQQRNSLDVSLVRQLASDGKSVFVSDSSSTRAIVDRIQFGEKEGNKIILLDGEETETTEDFRIFVSSPTLEKGEWKYASINMEYSKEELIEEIFVCMGKENWEGVQKYCDSARTAVIEDVKTNHDLETQMLELLGRKEEDLDDEGAVELLAVTHKTQERLKERRRELETAERKLEKEKEKYLGVVEWAAQVILFIRRFGQYSPFYGIDVERLVRLMDTRIPDEDLRMASPPRLWQSFWNLCHPPMDPECRKLLYSGLQLLHTGAKTFTTNEFEGLLGRYEEPDYSQMLSDVVWSEDCSNLTLIALTEPYCEVAVAVREIAKGTTVQWTSSAELAEENIEQPTDAFIWLGVTLSKGDELGELQNLVEKAKRRSQPSFRLFIVLPSLENISQDCLFFPNRVCLSSPSSLFNLLRHTSNLSPFRPFFHSAARSKKSNAIRLVAFHFAVRSRLKDVDDVELRMALTLFKETQCEEEKELEDLLVRVIGTVYLPRARNEVEQTLVKTLFRWIYQGLNKMDDSLIRGCVGGELDLEAVQMKLRRMEDDLFSGRAPKLMQHKKKQGAMKMVQEVNLMMKRENREKIPVKCEKYAEKRLWRECSGPSWRRLIVDELTVNTGDKTRREYLAALVHKENLAEIDVNFFSNPQRILLLLAAQLSFSQSVPLEEVTVMGFLEKTGTSTANRILLKNCTIRGARVENRELKEQEKPALQKVDIILEGMRKPTTSTKQEKTLPLLARGGLFLCDVVVRTNIALPHWHLRGAYFST